MEANEAPEKIYFTSNENGTHYYTEGIPSEREYIEYICKDTFIERVARFLEYKLNDRVEIRVAGTLIPSLTNKQTFIEEFKQFMKGEGE
jgi:hypothetical protein